MGGGFFDEFGSGGLRFGEVEAGDLEAVEEEAGAAGVDVVGGDALEDLADGVLDGGYASHKCGVPLRIASTTTTYANNRLVE